MTSEGHAHARFRRALAQGHLWAAEDAARELQAVSLGDALQLVYLYAHEGSPKFERAALRWLGRYLAEGSPELRDVAKVVTGLIECQDARYE